MPSTQVVEVAVDQLTKFGYKDANGYVSYSKKLSDSNKLKVVPGAKFEAEYYVADSGTRYLNKVFKTLQKVETVKIEKPVIAKAREDEKVAAHKVETPKSETMSKAEWSAKDRSQLIGGLSHDAAAICAAFAPMSPDVDTEGALKLYKELLVGMLKIRDEVK